MAAVSAHNPSELLTESITSNATLLWDRFNSSEDCFKTKLSEPVKIVDVLPTGTVRSHEVISEETLRSSLGPKTNSGYKLRLISICQLNSWSPLQASKDIVRGIVHHHGIHSGFLELPLSFRYRSTDGEQGFSVPWTLVEDGSKIEMLYAFRYPEFKGKQNEPWVIRQTGIYQQYDIQSKTSVWILINPMPDSVAEQRVLTCLSSCQAEISRNPLYLHSVIHASYTGNWRQYMAAYESILLPIADTTTATFITETLRVNHDTLGKVRSLESRFLPMKAILANFVDVLDELKDLTESLAADKVLAPADAKPAKRRLENCRKQCLAYSRSADFLAHRSDNTARLLADTLDFKNQWVTQEQDMKMLVLTRSAVFITVLTLIYLPWTFVSGLFGMNFFVFNSTTNRIHVTPEIWLYFAVSAGLTLITLALYCGVAGWFRDGDNPAVDKAPRMTLRRRYTLLAEKMASSKV